MKLGLASGRCNGRQRREGGVHLPEAAQQVDHQAETTQQREERRSEGKQIQVLRTFRACKVETEIVTYKTAGCGQRVRRSNGGFRTWTCSAWGHHLT